MEVRVNQAGPRRVLPDRGEQDQAQGRAAQGEHPGPALATGPDPSGLGPAVG